MLPVPPARLRERSAFPSVVYNRLIHVPDMGGRAKSVGAAV